MWDIENKTHKIIANKANIYSAYFIKHTHDFIYQSNKNNEVFVKNVNGKTVENFKLHFPTYGEVMTSDLKHYFASDQNFNIYQKTLSGIEKIHLYYCYQDHNGKNYKGKMTHSCSGFLSAGKLFTLTLSNNEKLLVGTGDDNVYMWNIGSKYGKILYLGVIRL